ncbi:MAG: NAD(P)-dependent oxidoreductase [Candidatus Omnitrophica bacterium]|nr:NAD(P)-dependent oxidoreductase [Candidatus Omnitrophota bacterium]
MKKLKQILKRIIFKHPKYLASPKWQGSGLLNVGVICNEAFPQAKWEELLNARFKDCARFCNIIFIKNKIEKYALAQNINVYFTDWLDEKYLSFAQSLKWVHFARSGIEFLEGVDMPGVIVTTSAGISSKYVAEYALAMILMFLRRIDIAIANQINYKWEQTSILSHTNSIDEITVGICGLGNNGKAAANLCKKAGFRVVGFDKKEPIDFSSLDVFLNGGQFDEFVKMSDFIVICVPLNKSTANMFGASQFSIMKSNAYIINTSRAGIIDEAALRKALNAGKIAAASTDVLPKEPCSWWYFLRRNKNFVITPHIAGNIKLVAREIQSDFIEKLKDYIQKK